MSPGPASVEGATGEPRPCLPLWHSSQGLPGTCPFLSLRGKASPALDWAQSEHFIHTVSFLP